MGQNSVVASSNAIYSALLHPVAVSRTWTFILDELFRYCCGIWRGVEFSEGSAKTDFRNDLAICVNLKPYVFLG